MNSMRCVSCCLIPDALSSHVIFQVTLQLYVQLLTAPLQARTRLFVIPFSCYIFWTACEACAYGMAPWHAAIRYTRVTVVAVAISAALELHSRKVFLRLLTARTKGTPVPESGTLKAGGSSKKHV